MPRKCKRGTREPDPDDYVIVARHNKDGTETVTYSGRVGDIPGGIERRGPPTPTYEDAPRAGREFGWNEAFPKAHDDAYYASHAANVPRGFAQRQMRRDVQGFFEGDYDGWDCERRREARVSREDYFGEPHGYGPFGGLEGEDIGYGDMSGEDERYRSSRREGTTYGSFLYGDTRGEASSYGSMGGEASMYRNMGSEASRYGTTRGFASRHSGALDHSSGYSEYPSRHHSHHGSDQDPYRHNEYAGYEDYDDRDGRGEDYGFDDYTEGGYGYDDHLGAYDGYNSYYGYGGYGGHGYGYY